MNGRGLVGLFLTVSLLLAGCSGNGDGATAAPAAAQDAGLSPPPDDRLNETLPVTILEWQGYSRVGVASDLPAHWYPPENVVEPIWKEGFYVNITDVQALEFSINWTGLEGSGIIFMAHSPHGHGQRMREYQTGDDCGGYTCGGDSRHMCMRIPKEDLESIPDGFWMPMFHPSPFGYEIRATITVKAVGGSIEIIDAYHGHDPTNPEEVYGPFMVFLDPDPFEECVGPLV